MIGARELDDIVVPEGWVGSGGKSSTVGFWYIRPWVAVVVEGRPKKESEGGS
jgi:hypothetical protein